MKKSRALLASTLALAGATGAGALGLASAQADTNQATVSYQAAQRTVSYLPGGTRTPVFIGIDKDGDKKTDAYAYCIEPKVTIPSNVASGQVAMASYPLSSYALADAGKVQWVAAHGFGAVSAEDLAAKVGVDVSHADRQRVARAMQAATQSAIWHHSHGMKVASGFRYDTRSVPEAGVISAVFTKTYQYLVAQAVSVQGTVTVWDSKPGDPESQGVIEVPTPGDDDCPCPEPSTPAPTPTPAPTDEPCPEPTTPAPCPTEPTDPCPEG